jgi:hypothetical protein
MSRLPALLAITVATLAPLEAQSVVVPNANANTRGTSQLNTLVRNSGNPRTYMLGINATELTGIPLGATINGVSFRFQVFTSNSPSWPVNPITWTDYQVFAGPVIPPAAFTGNFMANFTGTPVQVRSGPMTLPANTYTNTSPPAPAPNAWGEFYFDFQTPYVHVGGDLGLLFSHPGSTDTSVAQYLGTVASSAAGHGVALTQSTYPVGTGGASTTFCIPRIHYGFGRGCPGTGGRIPNLVQSGNTSGGLGGTILMTTTNAPALAPAIYLLGRSRASIPLPNGCTVLTTPIFTLVVPLDGNGTGAVPLSVPPGVIGGFTVQSVVVDLGAPLFLTVTNGIEPSAN